MDFVDFSCKNEHRFTDSLLRQLSGGLFNLFEGNMVHEINIKIHQEVKPSQITMRTRAKNEAKKL